MISIGTTQEIKYQLFFCSGFDIREYRKINENDILFMMYQYH